MTLENSHVPSANTLRKSRMMFSERHGIPSDVNYFVFMEKLLGTEVTPNRMLLEWAAKGEPSNFPTLASHMQRFSTFTPWQVHSVTRKVFAGRVPGVQAGAMAYDAIGRPPFAIAISDGMYAIADQCIYYGKSQRAFCRMHSMTRL